jgi:hypothetical protein
MPFLSSLAISSILLASSIYALDLLLLALCICSFNELGQIFVDMLLTILEKRHLGKTP